MSFNKVILLANLTRDIELRAVGSSGTQIANVGVALNRRFTTASGEKREEVTFVDCEAWGKTGEIMAKYLSKGSQVLLEGRLKLDTWDDKETGKKQSKLKVVVETFSFVGGKKDDGESQPRPNMNVTPGKNGGVAPMGDDDLPFEHGWESRYS